MDIYYSLGEDFQYLFYPSFDGVHFLIIRQHEYKMWIIIIMDIIIKGYWRDVILSNVASCARINYIPTSYEIY